MIGVEVAVEEFLASHSHTIAAVEAISTFAAVAVSLTLAIASKGAIRTRLRARATITTLFQPAGGAAFVAGPRFVTVDITNIGPLPLRIPLSFFRLRVRLKRGVTLFQPTDAFADQLVPQRHYPIEVQPNSSVSLFIVDPTRFNEMLGEQANSGGFWNRLRFRFFRLLVLTDDGRWFRVRIDELVRREIKLPPIITRQIPAPTQQG